MTSSERQLKANAEPLASREPCLSRDERWKHLDALPGAARLRPLQLQAEATAGEGDARKATPWESWKRSEA